MLPVSDSVTIVQIGIPEAWPVRIRPKQAGILKKRYRSGADYDTTLAGWGRCLMIKGNWYYYSVNKTKGYEPAQGDLLVTRCSVLSGYTGIFFDLLRFGISLTRVNEEQFFNSGEVFSFGPEKEKALLDSMLGDIHYTAEVMINRNDSQDFVVVRGPFEGRKIFSVMHDARVNDLQKIIDYIRARPSKYAGNSWKLSEIFATWVFEGAPMIVK